MGKPTTWDNLRRRAKLLQQVRAFFDQRALIEVETPLLCRETIVDTHLDPIRATLPTGSFFLQTSPELSMKRLLAAGCGDIYQITRSFRAGEQGRLHNSEFTIVEWYCLGQTPDQAMTMLSDLVSHMLGVPAAQRQSYANAFTTFAGIDPHAASLQELAKVAGVSLVGETSDRDECLDRILVEQVEPHLGVGRPTILYDYPASQAALAQVREGEVPVAERFEIYVEGIELANGYHELLDADILRQRNADANKQRAAAGRSELPEPQSLLAAMDAGLPACCGVALGFDRLVMLALGAKSISEVMSFTQDSA
jgi:lysyl-tRNA synthetase class 2